MNRMIVSSSPDESFEFARSVGKSAQPGQVYAVYGGLGAGKTLMAKGFAKGLGIVDEVVSPTFTIMESYDGAVTFYHFDLYRINDERELDHLGFDEYWNGSGVSFIEWPENAGSRIPDNAITIRITQTGENERRISIESAGD